MQTLEIPKAVVAAKAEFGRAKDRIVKALASTPDDKINWSPAPTARTPIHLVAHAGMSISGMQEWLEGKPFPFESMADLDTFLRKEEQPYTTREQALELLDKNSGPYLAWLDTLSEEKLTSMFETPMGAFPFSDAITWPADHLRGHASQLDYIQTIYGDREWHF
ncbi:MAG: DinB family protein [Fimbriimonas ginsengisoli]|uniref:DinB family protein n=1 Tax=Fimbriimonas ginsengisoli TaxID=1005039 RepID=A0A931PVG1_FIMGI|nr:DinB family protein [Fimbriimonas ginsengisoli]MBI3721274.1 DinB family protein [Fimbriimonas ginsengisoli]